MAEAAVHRGARRKQSSDKSPGMLGYFFDTPGKIDWEKEGDYGGFERNEIRIENS